MTNEYLYGSGQQSVPGAVDLLPHRTACAFGILLLCFLAGCGPARSNHQTNALASVADHTGWQPFEETIAANACDQAAKRALPAGSRFEPAYGWKSAQGADSEHIVIQRSFQGHLHGEPVSSGYSCVVERKPLAVTQIDLLAPYATSAKSQG